LPAAIAAPTPVSSLVHSSTLVTAGVYLLIRHGEFLTVSRVRYYLLVIGVLTMTMARIRALLERDLKKIVALSTLRQLGIIILGLGLGSFIARFFHLLRHAFFKALLFLGTGSIIHNSKDYQDMRVIGGGFPRLPITHRSILLARMRLMGIPFISAFFSKEMILETLIIKNINFIVYTMIFLGIMLTGLYSVRFVIYAFRRVRSGTSLEFKLDEDNFILQRILILVFPAIIAGFFLGNFLFSRPAVSSSRVESKILILVMLLRGGLIRVYLNFIF
jgi:NADH-ubiquinone oxidoreductase chain 5